MPTTDPFTGTSREIRYGSVPDLSESRNMCLEYNEAKSFYIMDKIPRAVLLNTTMQPLVSVRGAPVDRVSAWVTIATPNVKPNSSAKPPSSILQAFPRTLKFCVVPQVEGREMNQSLLTTSSVTITPEMAAAGFFLFSFAPGILCMGYNIYACSDQDPATFTKDTNIPAYSISLSFNLDTRGGSFFQFITNPPAP
jgi:hypothetical protein